MWCCTSRSHSKRCGIPSATLFMRAKIDIFRVAVLCVVLAISCAQTRADLLDDVNSALSIRDEKHGFQLQLTGLIDFEGYFIDQRPPGLINSDDSFLFNPRIRLFIDAQLGRHLYFFAQVRLDRGFDPVDSGPQLRLDEYFLRYAPFDN